ncbi:hypothetical protein MCUN1_002374 [Malassezia cuniculi]|uniref:Phosphatidyl-N-methylethanolamine N-methyltransferase n=1 Tax=Malassezia cuniculi TaxID=948313 RepID=A0AAF0EWA8_9BASI|nr:hypothetical protein MCUN1_002374 [Malassezia cuniculi]
MLVDLTRPSLALAAANIVFNPLFWNIVAQNATDAEYRRHTITRALGGNRYLGCYLLALTIFSLGILRDHLFAAALEEQPSHELLEHRAVRALGASLISVGMILVVSSMWVLGVTGTYLGDYFGILMDHMVTGFPFNVTSDPMYWGSSANFIGVALWYGKPAGLLLSALVIVCYVIALRYEGPFTTMIYKRAAEEKAAIEAAERASTLATGPPPHPAYFLRAQHRVTTEK